MRAGRAPRGLRHTAEGLQAAWGVGRAVLSVSGLTGWVANALAKAQRTGCPVPFTTRKLFRDRHTREPHVQPASEGLGNAEHATGTTQSSVPPWHRPAQPADLPLLCAGGRGTRTPSAAHRQLLGARVLCPCHQRAEVRRGEAVELTRPGGPQRRDQEDWTFNMTAGTRRGRSLVRAEDSQHHRQSACSWMDERPLPGSWSLRVTCSVLTSHARTAPSTLHEYTWLEAETHLVSQREAWGCSHRRRAALSLTSDSRPWSLARPGPCR